MHEGTYHDSQGHREFFGLSLSDLAAARDLYHLQLLNHPNVVGTALGLYLIRIADPWPQDQNQARRLLSMAPTAKEARRLDNSEVRPYSWPCVLAFVDQWIDYATVASGGADPDVLLPERIWLPDGRAVPVCVVEAVPIETLRTPLSGVEFPRSFVGSGFPILTDIQGETRMATIGAVVTDGRKGFAITSRHALGDDGSPVDTVMNGGRVRIGTCSHSALTRLPVSELYPTLHATNAFLNLDVGLIEIDDVAQWTTSAFGIGQVGPIADAKSSSLSLAIVGQPVVARGAASGEMGARVKGLLFRYKSIAGFEYVTDYLIGSDESGRPLVTQPGDSGTMWYLVPEADVADATTSLPRPLAIQWGGEVLQSRDRTAPYALASSLATICARLDLDVVRDWNSALFRYWGSVGHFSIALQAIRALPEGHLKTLLQNNLENITFPQGHIDHDQFKGLSKRFVPLADVPDLVWKIGAGQRGPRGANPENPNHFADMDQANTSGKTLLDICAKRGAALNPQTWLDYYSDPKVNAAPYHQGLLPFRIWQIYDAMVRYAAEQDMPRFMCAAGILAHYVGDACQPLHISALHDGDPSQVEQRTIHHRNGEVETIDVPRGTGVHSTYEDAMVNLNIADLFAGLAAIPEFKPQHLAGGADAAWLTIALMRNVIKVLPPRDIIGRYLEVRDQPSKTQVTLLWKAFGSETIRVMGLGIEALASLWLSTWSQAQMEGKDASLQRVDQSTILDIVVKPDFLPSFTLKDIGSVLDSDTHPG